MLAFLSRLTLPSKVLGGALAGALIFSGIQTLRLSWSEQALSSAKEVIQRLEGWQGQMVQAIGLASGNQSVTADTAQAQVQAMGTSLTTLANALKTSNDAVDRLARLQQVHRRRVADGVWGDAAISQARHGRCGGRHCQCQPREPEQAPHAIVMNKNGNSVSPLADIQPVKAGYSTVLPPPRFRASSE